jgi:hypothetical protein
VTGRPGESRRLGAGIRHHGDEGGRQTKIGGVQVPALAFEMPRDRIEIVQLDLRRPPCLYRCDMCLQHLQVVQPSERILHAPQLPDQRLRALRPAVGGELERIAQLLHGDADAVQAIGIVQVAGVGGGLRQCPGTREQPSGEPLPPAVGRRVAHGVGHLRQPPCEPFGLRPRQRLLGSADPACSRLFHVRTQIIERPRRKALTIGELANEIERDVELADAAERSRELAQPPPRLAAAAALAAAGQHRHGFTQPARRDPAPVHPGGIAAPRTRQLPAERVGAPGQQGCGIGGGGAAHATMTRTGMAGPGGSVPPVYPARLTCPWTAPRPLF